MAPPPASPCTRTHTRALPVHPLQVDGEWQTEPGTIPFCGALSALPSDAVQAESQVCTRMHTYAHVCITHELWSVSYAVYRDAGHTAQVNTNHQFQANTTTVGSYSFTVAYSGGAQPAQRTAHDPHAPLALQLVGPRL